MYRSSVGTFCRSTDHFYAIYSTSLDALCVLQLRDMHIFVLLHLQRLRPPRPDNLAPRSTRCLHLFVYAQNCCTVESPVDVIGNANRPQDGHESEAVRASTNAVGLRSFDAAIFGNTIEQLKYPQPERNH